jgi:hypothetical protein
MSADKKPKIIFAPGAFENFEGTQEELDELVSEITNMVESGDFLANVIPLESLPEEEMQILLQQMGIMEEDEAPALPTSWKLH